MGIESLNALRENIQKVFIGHPDSADRLLVCLLARGHALIEDVPGVGKTLLATALARSIDCAFSRIQLTPDLLPADVLGVSIYDRDRSEFRFNKGPIFANIVLADEINRTTPRTQSALLEAMSDGAVSVDGKTIKLEQPFMVVATQNPYEFEGTYYLPENQLDRFLMRIDVGYPSPEDESKIINLRPSDTMLDALKPVMHPKDVVVLQKEVDKVKLHDDLVQYIIRIAGATREHEELEVGLSPRGSLALAQVARATAFLGGRDYSIPEDITDNAVAVCAHRVVSRAFMQSGDSSISRQIMQRIMERVPSPA